MLMDHRNKQINRIFPNKSANKFFQDTDNSGGKIYHKNLLMSRLYNNNNLTFSKLLLNIREKLLKINKTNINQRIKYY